MLPLVELVVPQNFDHVPDRKLAPCNPIVCHEQHRCPSRPRELPFYEKSSLLFLGGAHCHSKVYQLCLCQRHTSTAFTGCLYTMHSRYGKAFRHSYRLVLANLKLPPESFPQLAPRYQYWPNSQNFGGRPGAKPFDSTEELP